MTTVIYHSADMDGIFCREIAKRFLGVENIEYIGWNFGDPTPALLTKGEFIIMDLPIDKPFNFKFVNDYIEWPDGKGCPFDAIYWKNFTWIDHHKSSIESHPTTIPGYRIDGVAACRLAWQYFSQRFPFRSTTECDISNLPDKQAFIDRTVIEPIAVCLAGEYDVWDKRDPDAETFQYGLRTDELTPDEWSRLLTKWDTYVVDLIDAGKIAQRYAQNVDASICNSLAWLMQWEGVKWLCVNHARFNSLLFAAKDKPETGHDALLGFRFDGKNWIVSLYHAKHRTDLDLSGIAARYGGGGHKGACGFTCKQLPFTL